MQNFLITTGWGLLLGAIVLIVWMLWTLHQEDELKRAPRILLPGLVTVVVAAAVLSADFPYKIVTLALGELVVLGAVLLFFLPLGQAERLVIPQDMPSLDERDVMFARAGYAKGEPSYRDYYSRHPEKQSLDDHIRSLPGLCSPGTSTYDPLHARIAGAAFHYLGHIRPLAEGSVSPDKQRTDPAATTKMLKGLAAYYGAKIVGVTEVKPYHYYSHRGRHPENYGDEVTKVHKYAIAFAVEMDYFMLKSAPQAPAILESSRQYVEGAKIGMILSYFIRELGYDARNHMDGNYLVCAPLVAHDAGIGELSRMGIIISRDYGPRIRLGVVTTDLELVPDHPVEFGVQDTCRTCKKCAQNCPAQAIPHEDKEVHAGTLKWQINQAKCYEFWCKVGTDCGVCLNTCPYSKPDSSLHRLFRTGLRRSSFARRAMVHLDDYVYGRRPFGSRKPDWM